MLASQCPLKYFLPTWCVNNTQRDVQLLSREFCVVLSLFSQNRVELIYPGALEARNYEALYPASGEKKNVWLGEGSLGNGEGCT